VGSSAFPGNVPPVDADSRDVSLTIPAKPGYLVLARLALSAVCRLTTLQPAEVADLKLAVTEAASEFVNEAGEDETTVDFRFRLHADRLVLELSGPSGSEPPDEQELSRAIIEATVDRADFSAGRTLLVKQLEP
jgi:anti-sigma regulatory factor (Ser/Thr protein kinase)